MSDLNNSNEEEGDVIYKKTTTPIKQTDKYTYLYRIVKTCLLVLAWVSFGINNEIVGSTLEDLRILLNSNYENISLALELRGLGYLIFVLFSGVFYDKFSDYADLIMAIASFFFAFPNYIVPFANQYWLMYVLFLVQGIATASYDLGGNHIVLGLWEGITSSPINAMHAGYGIGAIIAVQISKPFIRFDPLQKYRDEELMKSFDSSLNSSSSSETLTSTDIKLAVPYSVSASVGMLLTILFLIAQVIEIRNNKLFNKKLNENNQLEPLQKMGEEKKVSEQNDEQEKSSFLQKLFFGKRVFRGKALVYMIFQISLLVFLFFMIQGYITVISRYLLTYLTKGPANFSIAKYSTLTTLYWSFFILARFLAAFVAFKLNTILFVFVLLLLNMLVCLLFIIPIFTQYELFFWICICFMGLTSGPMQPSSFMVAKTFLVDYNSFILAIFSVGMSLGNIFFTRVSSSLLDKLNSYAGQQLFGFDNFQTAYIIAHVFFLPSLLCFLTFIPIYFIYKRYINLVKN